MLLNLSDLEGIIVILLLIFLVIAILKKATRFIVFCFCVLALMQTGYMLSKTELNDKLGLDRYFKYDIVESVRQIWEDTDKEELKNKIEEGTNTVVNSTSQLLEQIKNSMSSSDVTEEEAPPVEGEDSSLSESTEEVSSSSESIAEEEAPVVD